MLARWRPVAAVWLMREELPEMLRLGGESVEGPVYLMGAGLEG